MEFSYTLPSACAEELAGGWADVGIIPSIEYQRIPGLAILADPCIASLRRVRSIILLARRPLEEVETLAADTSSRTSVALADLLLRCRYGQRALLVAYPPEPAVMLAQCDAAVLIGDPALRYHQQPLDGVRAIDLVEEWRAWTGLPFVFAFWACRREVATPEIAGWFAQARDRGLAAISRIIHDEAPRRGLPEEVVRQYLTENMHYHLDDQCLAGLRRFYALAAEHGLIAAARELDIVEPELAVT
jgi:chorismate dehydratase